MATASPSPTDGDTTDKRTDTEQLQRHFDVDIEARDQVHERIDDVAVLEEGEQILIGDRKRPLCVRGSESRDVDARGGFVEQHAVEASGDWADAKTVLLITRISRSTGEPKGISVDKGAPEPVWRVDQ